jgi:hypothetical protein
MNTPKHTSAASPRFSTRTSVRAGVMLGDRDGDGILDPCTPPFSRGLPGGLSRLPGTPRTLSPL